MKKKVIGVFIAGNDREFHSKILAGLHTQAVKSDVRVLVFEGLLNRPSQGSTEILPEMVINGEQMIYNLANFDLLDGIVIVSDLFLKPEIPFWLLQKAKEHQLPVVEIDRKDEAENCYHILFDDKDGMEQMVKHIIDVHGCRKINFISGYPNNRQSEEREAAYRRALTERGIEIEEDRISFGEFNGVMAEEVMAQYIRSHMELPEAVVCANDTMAISIVNYFIREGYDVPENILVTGFDGIEEALDYLPSITTVRRAIYESGEETVRLFLRIWNGEKPKKDISMNSVLEFNQSCGCKIPSRVDIGMFYQEKDATITAVGRFHATMVYVSNELAFAKSISEMADIVIRYADAFQMDNMVFCLCDNLDANETDEGFFIGAETAGYTKQMTLYEKSKDKKTVHSESFSSDEILPELEKRLQDKGTYHFTPLYYQKTAIGYVGYHPQSTYLRFSFFYTLLRTVSNAIGDFYVRSARAKMVERLEAMSVEDAVTKLYNRHGLYKFGEKLLEEYRESGKFVFGLVADLDGLKLINDNFGHAEGDNAIAQIAAAIKQVCKGEDVCARTGGDEFFVIGVREFREEGDIFVSNLQKCLVEYNIYSNKSYQVECSCGYYMERVDAQTTLEQVMHVADWYMYKHKNAKKEIAALVKRAKGEQDKL